MSHSSLCPTCGEYGVHVHRHQMIGRDSVPRCDKCGQAFNVEVKLEPIAGMQTVFADAFARAHQQWAENEATMGTGAEVWGEPKHPCLHHIIGQYFNTKIGAYVNYDYGSDKRDCDDRENHYYNFCPGCGIKISGAITREQEAK